MTRRLAQFALCLLAALPTVPISIPPAHAEQSEAPAQDRQILVMTRLPPAHFQLNSGYGGSYGSTQSRTASRHIAERIARDHGLSLIDDWPMPLIGLNCFVMVVPANQTVEDAVKAVSSDKEVALAEPMQVYETKGAPAAYNDKLFAAQPDAKAWHLAKLHEIATGRGVNVAVIDSGIDNKHPDLAGQVSVAMNFISGTSYLAENHGTAVAGIIAAKAGNGIGIVGVAPGARLMALRACSQSSANANCDTLSLAKALSFAIDRKANIINLSLAGPRGEVLGRLLDVALSRNMSVVAAFDPRLPDGGFPASHQGVVAVADEDLARSPRGVYNAPGRDVITTQPGGKWSLVNGNSFAAAHVSGLLALMKAKPGRAKASLVAARTDGGPINACASLTGTTGACDCACGKLANSPTSARN
jgi:subtilisin family serine protease